MHIFELDLDFELRLLKNHFPFTWRWIFGKWSPTNCLLNDLSDLQNLHCWLSNECLKIDTRRHVRLVYVYLLPESVHEYDHTKCHTLRRDRFCLIPTQQRLFMVTDQWVGIGALQSLLINWWNYEKDYGTCTMNSNLLSKKVKKVLGVIGIKERRVPLPF